jgi:hypothetical protein
MLVKVKYLLKELKLQLLENRNEFLYTQKKILQIFQQFAKQKYRKYEFVNQGAYITSMGNRSSSFSGAEISCLLAIVYF